MNYVQEAIERLEEYRHLQAAVENIKQELFALKAESDMLGAQRLTDMPRGSGWEPDDRLCNNIAKRKELAQRLDISQRRIHQVENVLNMLDEDERKLIEILYIRGGKKAIERAMEEFNYEKTKIYTMKNDITKKVAKMLLGVGVA